MEFYCSMCKDSHELGECIYKGLCSYCKKREATLHFGDMLSFTHFGGLNCCDLCCAEMQLDHAKKMAVLIPEREAEVALLKEKYGSE